MANRISNKHTAQIIIDGYLLAASAPPSITQNISNNQYINVHDIQIIGDNKTLILHPIRLDIKASGNDTLVIIELESLPESDFDIVDLFSRSLITEINFGEKNKTNLTNFKHGELHLSIAHINNGKMRCELSIVERQ